MYGSDQQHPSTKRPLVIETLPGIRNAVRALIVRDSHLLALRKTGGGRGERFALPGGAQELGESLTQALNRECIEEIGTAVAVGAMVQVADFFKLRNTQPTTRRHVVEFLFRCEVPDGYQARNGERPDKYQVDVVWVPLDEVDGLNLLPAFLADGIRRQTAFDGNHSLYLGAFEDDAITSEH